MVEKPEPYNVVRRYSLMILAAAFVLLLLVSLLPATNAWAGDVPWLFGLAPSWGYWQVLLYIVLFIALFFFGGTWLQKQRYESEQSRLAKQRENNLR